MLLFLLFFPETLVDGGRRTYGQLEMGLRDTILRDCVKEQSHMQRDGVVHTRIPGLTLSSTLAGSDGGRVWSAVLVSLSQGLFALGVGAMLVCQIYV